MSQVVATPPPSGPSPLRRFLSFLVPFRGWLLLLGGVVLLHRLLQLPPPLIYKAIVDEALVERDLPHLALLIGLMAAIHLASQGVGFGLQVLSTKLQQGVLHEVRVALYAHLQRLDLGFYRRHPTGGLLSRIMSDVAQVQGILSREALEVVASSVQLVIVGVLLLLLDWKLALACAAVFPILIALVLVFQRRLYRISRELQERREALSARIQEHLSGIRLIQALVLEAPRLAKIRHTSGELRDMVVRSEIYGSSINLLAVVLTDLPLTLFVWGVGGYLVIQDQFTLGSLLAFWQYLMLLYDPVIRIFGYRVKLELARAAVDRIYEVLDTEPAVADRPDARSLEVQEGRVRFERVTLAYGPDEPPAVVDLDLELAPGEILGLVGPSGGGKTTVVNGLLRFLSPTRGRICIDGQDLEDVTLASLRRQVGLVAQEPFLFSESLADNLALGSPAADRARLEQAATAAQAHGFLAALPEGYDTLVGERGAGLSGGEKQRIALARVFLQDPRLLVFDEATSALDSQAEQLLQEALARLVAGRTVLVIAHRFSTLKLCHRIAVLAGGRLVELGTHEELLRQGGLYRALHQAQVL